MRPQALGNVWWAAMAKLRQRRAARAAARRVAKQNKGTAHALLVTARQTYRTRRREYRKARRRLRRFMLRPLAWTVGAVFGLFVGLGIVGNLVDPPEATTTTTAAPSTTAEEEAGGFVTPDTPTLATSTTIRATTTRPATTTTRATTTTWSEEDIAEMAFNVLVIAHPVLSNYPLDLLHAAAGDVCNGFDQGLSFELAALAIYSESPADWDPETVGNFIGMAVSAYCPEYQPLIEQAADTWG